jgi:sulfopyruvate decarboxylase TPP-binding subunit
MADPSWSKHVADVLRRNDIHFFATVPDYIVSQVLEHLWADPACTVVTATREEEALRHPSGPGRRPAWRPPMQNSGLGNCINTLASERRFPASAVLVISHRGDLGEFNPAQVPMGRGDALHPRGPGNPARHAAVHRRPGVQADGLVKLAYTQALPVAFVLTPS